MRSADISPNARHSVSEADLAWADVVFAMEEKHKSRLPAEYLDGIASKPCLQGNCASGIRATIVFARLAK